MVGADSSVKFLSKYALGARGQDKKKHWLGMGDSTKKDEFSEKFQTAFDTHSLIFGKLYCNFL